MVRGRVCPGVELAGCRLRVGVRCWPWLVGVGVDTESVKGENVITQRTQPELDLRTRETRKRVGPKLAARMIARLSVAPGWVTRRQFADELGWYDSRKCRLACECAHGRVIFGRHGYRLLRQSTQDEIGECLARITTEIQSLQEKHRLIARRAHQQVAGVCA